MSGDRKVVPSDFINLKAKVKAEVLRRNQSGSVAAYGAATYDYSTSPSVNGPIFGEHLKKNLEPMQAVNGDGLPVYPGGLTKPEQQIMETKVDAWATRNMADRSATDCKSGCTGTCYSGCATGCYTGCYTGCDGCDGCSGCGSGCATGCSGCGGACSTNCSGGCSGSCTVSCGNAGCSGECISSCYGCSGGCGTGCDTGCGGYCGGACGGCGGCGSTCSGVSK